ncbi:MAG: hypothetical protein MJY61_01770 [Bacteroidales bacterium]|nr:hypothetical protein [Bacteroidales bacterium]
MKTQIRIASIIAVMAFAASCAVAPSITVNPTSISMKAAGGKADVTVDANCDWTVKTDQNWASARKGSSNGNLTINVSKNSNPDPRTATITLSAEGVSAVITVNQEQKNSIVIDGDFKIFVTEESQEASLSLKSNTDYKVTISPGADWIKFKAITKGIVESSAVFTLAANDSFESRTAEITFEAEDCNPIPATVIQYGKPRILGVGVAGIEEFKVPSVNNDESAAVVIVAGSEVPYQADMSVSVNPAGDLVSVKAYELRDISLGDLEGVSKLDLTKLF